MKKLFLIVAPILIAAYLLCIYFLPIVIKDLKYCEGTLAYKDSLIVTNFGTDGYSPLSMGDLGYIVSVSKDKKITTLVPRMSGLNSPKGMAMLKNRLYVADVSTVAVFDTNDMSAPVIKIRLGVYEEFVNDVVSVGQSVYVSISNSGNIYKITPGDNYVVQKITNVYGANGLAYDQTTKRLFIASYAISDKITDKNKIYVIEDLNNPTPKIFFDVEGSYDGISINPKRNKLYVSSWGANTTPVVYSIDMNNPKLYKTIKLPKEMKAPADISYLKGRIWVPDLLKSKVWGLRVF